MIDEIVREGARKTPPGSAPRGISCRRWVLRSAKGLSSSMINRLALRVTFPVVKVA